MQSGSDLHLKLQLFLKLFANEKGVTNTKFVTP